MNWKRLGGTVLMAMICLLPVWSTQSSATESECWQLLDQANEKLTQLSRLLETYRDASEKQDAVLEQAVREAVEKATGPLWLKIAEQGDRLERLRKRVLENTIIGSLVGVVVGLIIGLLVPVGGG